MSESTEMLETLLERLDWQTAERDDLKVASIVAVERKMDTVHRLDQGGLLDIFMVFLDQIGFIKYLAGLRPKLRQRFMIPTVTILLTYMTKILVGVKSVYALPQILLSDPCMMKVLGFNARWSEQGLCNRSHEKRHPDKEPARPFSAQMVANFLGDLMIRESMDFFNQAIRCLARFGAFPREVTLVLDGTDIETTDKCLGAGRTTRTKEQRDRQGRIHCVEVTVFGFRAVVAFEISTQLPVGCIVTKIQRHEMRLARRLVRQVGENLAPGGSKVVKVIVDRGFVDGEFLWWLDQQGIAFVVPARKDMLIYKGAVARAGKGQGHFQSRKRTVNRGHGKKRTRKILKTEVMGVTGLTLWENYGDPTRRKERRRRGYVPNPINAVVVLTWDGDLLKPQRQVVFLTNQSVTKPLSVFDDYDRRSLIENILFREGKQGWHLERIPQKTQRAAVAHIFITFTMIALTTAYRQWQRQQDEQAKANGERTSTLDLDEEDESLGVRRWRRLIRERTRDHVIVFADAHYGIFHLTEFALFLGARLQTIPDELGSPEDIFRRYHLDPPP